MLKKKQISAQFRKSGVNCSLVEVSLSLTGLQSKSINALLFFFPCSRSIYQKKSPSRRLSSQLQIPLRAVGEKGTNDGACCELVQGVSRPKRIEFRGQDAEAQWKIFKISFKMYQRRLKCENVCITP